MKKRFSASAAAYILSLSLLAGCGVTPGSSVSGSASESTQASVSKTETSTEVSSETGTSAETGTEVSLPADTESGLGFVTADAYEWKEVPELEGCEVVGIPYMWRADDRCQMDAPVKDGLYIVEKGEQRGLIDLDCNWIAEPKYASVSYGYGYIIELDPEKYFEDIYTITNGQLTEVEDEWAFYDLMGTAPNCYIVYDTGTNTVHRGGGGGAEITDKNIQVEGLVGVEACILKKEFDMEYPEYLYDGDKALLYNGKLVTEFIFKDVKPESCGLCAVKLGDYWGYADAEGKTVIPAKYDAYISNTDYHLFPPACTDGYVVLRENGERYSLCDSKGNIIIPAGEFEILTEVTDGRLFARKDGVWGVLTLAKG